MSELVQNRFGEKLTQLRGYDPNLLEDYAAQIDPIYGAKYIYELVVYKIDIEQANEYAERYQDRFNDFNLLFLLRANISHQAIAKYPQTLSARGIVLAEAGALSQEAIALSQELPELLVDSIEHAFKSGMKPDEIKQANQAYKKLALEDDLDPASLDRYARLSLISRVPADYYKAKLSKKVSPRLILDHYNSEQADLQELKSKLKIAELNKLPLKHYQRMQELVQGAKAEKPLALYLTTNFDHGDHLLFSAWHEALSLTENYELLITEANSQKEIIEVLKNIPHKITAVIISYHGHEENQNQMLVINQQNQITCQDQNFIQELDQFLEQDCKLLVSCCHSQQVTEMIFNTSSKITQAYAPGTDISYGCIKALPEAIFFEKKETVLKWNS
ncbi:MAG: hypothetical protein OXU45_00420 [Candidatus Melainabacteria bacterium]|nr:hypothetical protein [Candidatus Melainabacteria bacterium]